jgi:hypothetical protein
LVSWGRRILALVAIAGVLALAWWHFFPNEEKRVRRMLDRVAQTASIPAKPSPVGMVMSLDRLQGYLSRDVEVVLDVPIEGRRTFADRAELMEAVKVAWANVRSVKVEFLDINLKFDAAKTTATAELTARVTQAGQRDFFVQEVKLELRKQEEGWRIRRAETVRTLRQ